MDADPDLDQILLKSRSLGFLGPGDIETHVRHAQGFVDLLRSQPVDHALDLGSGGGLPGLVIALELRSLALTLLDANERRVAFLRDAVRQLGIGERVSVVVGRAEALARDPQLREQFDVVVARSFGAPAVTAECAAGFLRPQGVVLVSEPHGSTDRWPEAGLALLGLAPGQKHEFESSTIRELRRTATELDAVPRAVGVPGRRPRF